MTYMGYQIAGLLFAPIQIIIAIYLIYSYIGVSFLAGIAVMVITIFITFLLTKKIVKANDQVLKAKDVRLKVTQ
jgi:hypothetical protein